MKLRSSTIKKKYFNLDNRKEPILKINKRKRNTQKKKENK